jgi:GT2 family glycosyltransferase
MPKISVVLPILTPTPFLRAMTEFCIKTLRAHADYPFELVVVEAGEPNFDPKLTPADENPPRPDKYLHFPQKIGQVKEINRGIDAASGDFIVFTGNDLVAPPHWDTELLRPFELYKDCGASCLAAGEPGSPWIGSQKPLDLIVEGMFSPFTMFKRGWRYSEDYVRIFQDSDLIMRLYEAGLRAYRNNRASVIHFNRMTNDNVDAAAHNEQLEKDARLFYKRWGKSPLWMFGMMKGVYLQYGKEHEAWLRNCQYDQ